MSANEGPIRRYVECKNCKHYPAYHKPDGCEASIPGSKCPCPGFVSGIDREVHIAPWPGNPHD